jgi:hypothetical protein
MSGSGIAVAVSLLIVPAGARRTTAASGRQPLRGPPSRAAGASPTGTVGLPLAIHRRDVQPGRAKIARSRAQSAAAQYWRLCLSACRRSSRPSSRNMRPRRRGPRPAGSRSVPGARPEGPASSAPWPGRCAPRQRRAGCEPARARRGSNPDPSRPCLLHRPALEPAAHAALDRPSPAAAARPERSSPPPGRAPHGPPASAPASEVHQGACPGVAADARVPRGLMRHRVMVPNKSRLRTSSGGRFARGRILMDGQCSACPDAGREFGVRRQLAENGAHGEIEPAVRAGRARVAPLPSPNLAAQRRFLRRRRSDRARPRLLHLARLADRQLHEAAAEPAITATSSPRASTGKSSLAARTATHGCGPRAASPRSSTCRSSAAARARRRRALVLRAGLPDRSATCA